MVRATPTEDHEMAKSTLQTALNMSFSGKYSHYVTYEGALDLAMAVLADPSPQAPSRMALQLMVNLGHDPHGLSALRALGQPLQTALQKAAVSGNSELQEPAVRVMQLMATPLPSTTGQ